MSALSTPRTKTSQSCVYPSGVVRIRSIDVCPHSNVMRIAILFCKKSRSPFRKEKNEEQLIRRRTAEFRYIFSHLRKRRSERLPRDLQNERELSRKTLRSSSDTLSGRLDDGDSSTDFRGTQNSSAYHLPALVLYENVNRRSRNRRSFTCVTYQGCIVRKISLRISIFSR